jgi:hypothetical protein
VRSHAELADAAPWVQRAADFDLGNSAGADIKLKRADRALAVKQA